MGKTISQLRVGDTDSFEKTISESDIIAFANISGDTNPLHLNELESTKSIFKKRVAHGILVSGLISAVLGTRLPGQGCIYLGQNLRFTAPVYIGDTIKATVTVQKIIREKNICVLDTVCVNQDNIIVITGEAVVRPLAEGKAMNN